MKTRWIVAASSLAFVAASFANDLYHPAASAEEGMALRAEHMKSVPRSQVEDDVLAARRDGTLTNISRGYPPRYPLGSGPALTRTRQQVEQELQAWKTQPVGPDGRRMLSGGGFAAREAP